MSASPNMPLLRLIQGRCKEDKNSGCWLWAGSRNGKGYANTIAWPIELGGDGRAYNGHVLAYIALKGRPPAEMELDHLCRAKACCNPWHLQPVSSSENKLRRRVGVDVPMAALWWPSPLVAYPLVTVTDTGIVIVGTAYTATEAAI